MQRIAVVFALGHSLSSLALPEECQGDRCKLTSKGWWPNECVHNVPNGTLIRTLAKVVEVTFPNGTAEIHLPCAANIPKESLARLHRAPSTKNNTGPVSPNNIRPVNWWLDLGGQSLDSFTATYNVPQVPRTGKGGSWWFGVEPSSYSTVLQPVVYFHTSGWKIVSENCCPHGHDYRQGDTSVSVGTTVQGSLKRTSGTAYEITTSAEGHSYTLNADNGEAMTHPLIEMEMNGDSYQCTDVPSGAIHASNIQVSPSMAWGTPTGTLASQCGWTVNGQGSEASASPPGDAMTDIVV